jgi:hypothetical protein
MREHNPRPRPPHHRRHLPQQRLAKEDQHVIADALVKLRPKRACGCTGLSRTDPASLVTAGLCAAAVAAGDIEIVELPAGLLEQEHRAGSGKLDIVGVGDDREHGWWL